MTIRLALDSELPDDLAAIPSVNLDLVERYSAGFTTRLDRALAIQGMRTMPVPITSVTNEPPKGVPSNLPVLIAIGSDSSEIDITRLMESLSDSLCPALVLIDDPNSRPARFLQAEGILCEPLTIDPTLAATILRTLAQRQPAIQRLRTDLRVAEMTITGVQTEVAKLHEELQSAASIQREYLPPDMPELESVELGIIYRPASYVSGDIYDITPLDEHHTAFFLADAVGHGVPAALMTMIITQGLRKFDGDPDDPTIVEPREVLERLNAVMTAHKSSSSTRFATAVYAVHDNRTNTFTIAGAGHPPALVVRAKTGATELVESQGPLLGIFDDLEFEQSTIQLDQGDVLIFYSDGFEVAFPSPDGSIERRLPTDTYMDELATAGRHDIDLQSSMRALEASLDHQTGSLHQPDDITALFISPTNPTPISFPDLLDAHVPAPI